MNWLTGACSHSDIFTYIYIARQRDMSMKRSGIRMHRVDKLEVTVVKVMLILRYYSSELRHSFFSLCVSIQNIERAK